MCCLKSLPLIMSLSKSIMTYEETEKYEKLHTSFLRRHVNPAIKTEKNFKPTKFYLNSDSTPKYIATIETPPNVKNYKKVKFIKLSSYKSYEYLYRSKDEVYVHVYDTDRDRFMISFGFLEIKFAKMSENTYLPVSFVKFGFEIEAMQYFNFFSITLENVEKINQKLFEIFNRRHIRESKKYKKEFYNNLYENYRTLPEFITSFAQIPNIEDYDIIRNCNERECDKKGCVIAVSKKKHLCDICYTGNIILKKNESMCELKRYSRSISPDSALNNVNKSYQHSTENFYIVLKFGIINNMFYPVHFIAFEDDYDKTQKY